MEFEIFPTFAFELPGDLIQRLVRSCQCLYTLPCHVGQLNRAASRMHLPPFETAVMDQWPDYRGTCLVGAAHQWPSQPGRLQVVVQKHHVFGV
ncbi:MAG: hypothetical protein R3E84_23915 [Pseudomonadales bacterium]